MSTQGDEVTNAGVSDENKYEPLNIDLKNTVFPNENFFKDTIAFWIERSKNKNIVVYEAFKDSDTLDYYNNINAYWLELDPEHMKTNRKNGKLDDISKLTYVEQKMAYGVHVDNKTVSNEKKNV